MDPQATYNEITSGDLSVNEKAEKALDLLVWLALNGFAPRVKGELVTRGTPQYAALVDELQATVIDGMAD